MQDDHSTTGPLPSQAPTPNQARCDAEAEWRERRRQELARERREIAIRTLGGIKAFEEYTFDRFDRNRAPQAFDAAFNFDPKRQSLFFWGDSQVGKTHLSTAIAHRAIDRGLRVFAAIVPEFKDAIRQLEHAFDYNEKKRILDRCVDADVVVLQEMGRGNVSKMIQAFLLTIHEKRILAGRHGMIWTSNYPLYASPDKQSIASEYGPTIAGRIEKLCGPNGVIRFPNRARAAAANE